VGPRHRILVGCCNYGLATGPRKQGGVGYCATMCFLWISL
jgi:hypothetical protein